MLYKKYETELYIAGKTKRLDKFYNEWKFKTLSRFTSVANAFVYYPQFVLVCFLRLCLVLVCVYV